MEFSNISNSNYAILVEIYFAQVLTDFFIIIDSHMKI